MQIVTLTTAIIASGLVCFLRPPYALVCYIGALVWYPSYLRVSIGTIDISVGRFVVLVLLLRCLCDEQIRRKFIWSRLDTLVSLSMVVYVGMYLSTQLTQPLAMTFENRAGFVMDTFLSYIVVRFIVTNRENLVSLVKGVGIVIAALAILGIFESLTQRYLFIHLRHFRPWTQVVNVRGPEGRFGFGRANGPFSHSILFGACFVMFLPLVWALRHRRGYWGKLACWLSAIVVLGALSSMSSGPWGMLVVVIFCLVLEKYKRWTKVVLASLVVLCMLGEFGSNRPLHHVIYSYLNLTKGDWYQRARLIDIGIERIDEWWLFGYGGKEPGWGQAFGKSTTDGNNEFLVAGVKYGILGIVALCAVLVTAFRGLVRAFRETLDKELRSLYWAMGSALVGIIVIWQGVSFFGQMPALFYSILGIIGSSLGFEECAKLNSVRSFAGNNSNLIWAHRPRFRV